MKVEDLMEETQSDIFSEKRKITKQILASKIGAIVRCEKVLAELKKDLEEFKQSDVEDIDISGLRY